VFLARGLLQYAHRPLIYTSPSGEVTDIVSGIVQLDAMAGYGLGPVRLGLDVPVYLLSMGSEGNATGLGDIAVDGKVRLMRRAENPLGLAFDARLALPTQTTALALGNDGPQGDLVLVLDRSAGPWLIAGNVGARLQSKVELENAIWGPQALLRLGASRALGESDGIALELFGQSSFSDLGNTAASPLEALVGGWHRIHGSGLVLRGGLGTGLTSGVGSPRFRALVSAGWEPLAEGDRDKDGILDARDRCPSDPEDRDAWEDEDGCPEPTLVTFVVQDPYGHPVSIAKVSFEGGSAGPGKAVPFEPGSYKVVAAAPGHTPGEHLIEVPSGPPVERPLVILPFGKLVLKVLDTDGKPLEASILVKGQGVEPASSTATTLEKILPAGTVQVEVRKEDFAPYVESATIEPGRDREVEVRLARSKAEINVAKARIDIKDSVFFDLDKASIRPESTALLREVAQLILDHPELLKIRIEGHTDSQGEADYNLELSKARAAAVLQFLVARGVAPERLESEGFGETRPLVKGDSEAAWARNRRVDFFVKERKDEK
jgi:outer membrane protein OmpA-like peptidoglycan-associated protein